VISIVSVPVIVRGMIVLVHARTMLMAMSRVALGVLVPMFLWIASSHDGSLRRPATIASRRVMRQGPAPKVVTGAR